MEKCFSTVKTHGNSGSQRKPKQVVINSVVKIRVLVSLLVVVCKYVLSVILQAMVRRKFITAKTASTQCILILAP